MATGKVASTLPPASAAPCAPQVSTHLASGRGDVPLVPDDLILNHFKAFGMYKLRSRGRARRVPEWAAEWDRVMGTNASRAEPPRL